MIRILFLIRSLGAGGAERQLVELVKGLSRHNFLITIVKFYDDGVFESELEAMNSVQVISLNKSGRWDLIRTFRRVKNVIKQVKPDIIHGYMGVANELSLLVARMYRAKAVWGLRTSYIDFSQYDWASRLSFRISALLSRFCDLIIVNSKKGKDYHVSHGYHPQRMVVIPNGIDINKFCPNDEFRRRQRAKWQISEHEILIGLPARLDPMKDHSTFIKAAALIGAKNSAARFVCIGKGSEDYQIKLQNLCRELEVEGRFIWEGFRHDMHKLYNALDLVVSSSYGEGFPNTIGEAMATGIPCVVTDTGDSAWIVGDTGYVVPTQDPDALAAACLRMIDQPDQERIRLGEKARQRIISDFSNERLFEHTDVVLRNLMNEG